jgi:hypothetical protein
MSAWRGVLQDPTGLLAEYLLETTEQRQNNTLRVST